MVYSSHSKPSSAKRLREKRCHFMMSSGDGLTPAIKKKLQPQWWPGPGAVDVRDWHLWAQLGINGNLNSPDHVDITELGSWWRHRNIFRDPDPLWGESTGHRSSHKAHGLWYLMFSLICAWTKCWINCRGAGDLRRHHANYVVTVMWNQPETCTIWLIPAIFWHVL